MIRKLIIIYIGIILTTIISCQKPSTTMSYEFKNDIWNSFNDIKFDSKFDTDKTYEIKVIISISDKFEPANFSFAYNQSSEEGESVYTNFQIPVKDSQGNFVGEKQGGYYTYTVIIRKKTFFNSHGKYIFGFESIMNKYNVKGIHKLELIITPI